MTWNRQESIRRIRAAAEACKDVTVTDLTRESDFANLSINEAFRVDGVHVYVDIPNARELLDSTDVEGERSHKRFLRFLNIYQRVSDVVFQETDAVLVDFQNQRLHFIVYKPYDSEKRRIQVAVAIARLIADVLKEANSLHAEVDDAKSCVGIESGVALAVSNGTRGDRELLFLGNPANHAAKLLSASEGIFLGDKAREALGWTKEGKSVRLTMEQIAECEQNAKLSISSAMLLDKWKEEVEDTPLSDISFSRPIPPLKDIDFSELTPANSRRIDACVLFADIDGFTKFVAQAIGDDALEKKVVQAMHVVRKELRDVLSPDMGGKKVRYVGDCLVGVVAEGAKETDERQTVGLALRCAGALRDAFGLIKDELGGLDDLGLAIGIELGPTSLTRLGIKTRRVRCAAGRAVYRAEHEQTRCNGVQTALGEWAWAATSAAVQARFKDRRTDSFTYNVASTLTENEAKSTKADAPAVILPRAHSR